MCISKNHIRQHPWQSSSLPSDRVFLAAVNDSLYSHDDDGGHDAGNRDIPRPLPAACPTGFSRIMQASRLSVTSAMYITASKAEIFHMHRSTGTCDA